jgi:alpha-amylase
VDNHDNSRFLNTNSD